MKFLKIILLMGFLSNLFSCNKIKNIENKINPGSPYKKAGIDPFYWEAEDDDKYYIPLIKPLRLIKWKGNEEWNLDTSTIGWKYGDMGPISTINTKNIYVYGFQDVTFDDEKKITSPAFFFIINVKTNEIKTYDYNKKRNEFEQEIRNLKLPEKYLEPHNIYWEFERYPDLEWFPEDIKKQLREIKTKLKR